MKRLVYWLKYLFFANALILIMVGCSDIRGDTYTIEKGSDGTIYRLNKHTGHIVAIIGTNAYEVSMPESLTKGGGKLSEAKYWPAQTIPLATDNIVVNIRTIWRDGKLYYKTSIPHSDLIERMRMDFGKAITPVFYDKSGFTVLQADVNLRQMTRILDSNRKVALYEYEGTKDCSPSAYADITGCNVMWNFE